MRCTTARKVMAARLDGEASERERRRLEAHLERCAECRDHEALLNRLTGAWGALAPTASVPPSMESEVMRRIRSLEPEPAPSWGERLRGWFPAPVLAAGLAVLVLAIGLQRTGGRPEDGRLPAVAVPAAEPARAEPTRDRAEATPKPPRVIAATSGTSEPAPTRGTAAALAPRGPAASPPEEMLAELPLLLDLPILRNMEKLEYYDTIKAVSAADDEESSG